MRVWTISELLTGRSYSLRVRPCGIAWAPTPSGGQEADLDLVDAG